MEKMDELQEIPYFGKKKLKQLKMKIHAEKTYIFLS